jgi:U3 small nucleolar RNA-associated protein 10
MSTSLAEQLKKLQTPQSSQFYDSKKRDSILFTKKEAATKSRETIYEIGISGLQELIELDSNIFEDFQKTLFDPSAMQMQRAVENEDVNRLINKNIRRFMFHLSPYFMISSSHKCLEWLIRRYNINLYNKDELLILILPYHHTNMFVRCIQTINVDDPNDKWHFLLNVKKSSTPLSKQAIWNHGANRPKFLQFVGEFTYSAVRELGSKAGILQTMISFYFTSIVGALEYAQRINDNHILSVVQYLFKCYKSFTIDYVASGYMITAQLVTKARLSTKLLNEINDRIIKYIKPELAFNAIQLLALIFETQIDELKLSDETLENLINLKFLPKVLNQLKTESNTFNKFFKALIHGILKKVQENDEKSPTYKDICERLLNEIDMQDEDAEIVTRYINLLHLIDFKLIHKL